jgi:hypothetical protein
MVEDITDSFEFFVKEMLDLKVYDILIVSGYKSRNRGIDTMVKISIEKFTEQAVKSGKFDAQRTVSKVRASRKSTIKNTPTSPKKDTIQEISIGEENNLEYSRDDTEYTI